MSEERTQHDPWSWAVWCSIPGIITGMSLSSFLESSVQAFFVWNPGTISIGILGGIFDARVGFAIAARKIPGPAFWAVVAIVLLMMALFGPTG